MPHAAKSLSASTKQLRVDSSRGREWPMDGQRETEERVGPRIGGADGDVDGNGGDGGGTFWFYFAADQSTKSLLTVFVFSCLGWGFFVCLSLSVYVAVSFFPLHEARATFRFHYPKRVQIHFKFCRRRRQRRVEASLAVQLLAFARQSR